MRRTDSRRVDHLPHGAGVQRTAQSYSDKLADTVDEFCARVGISRRHFYGLLRRGEAPATVTVGRRRLVRRGAGEVWLRERERAGGLAC